MSQAAVETGPTNPQAPIAPPGSTPVTTRPARTLADVIAESPQLRSIMARVAVDSGNPGQPIEDENDPVVVRRAVLAERTARWREGWATHMPRRYLNASLTMLKPGQDPDGKVTGWLDSGHLGLALAGPAGRGKTYVLAAIGYAALDRQVKPLLITMADLNDSMRPGGDSTVYDKCVAADVLLLDDLGREKITEWTLEQLQRLMDARNRQARRTAWSTNLPSPDALEDRYGEPIRQRLLDDTVSANFAGVAEVLRPAAEW